MSMPTIAQFANHYKKCLEDYAHIERWEKFKRQIHDLAYPEKDLNNRNHVQRSSDERIK